MVYICMFTVVMKKLGYSKNIVYVYATILRVQKVYGNRCVCVCNDLTW